jgi:hypothetical protein
VNFRQRGLALLFAMTSAAASLPSASAADPPSDTALARDLFREGAALAQQGKWEEALNRYARSLKLRRASLTLYSLGVAQKQTGRLVEAHESFRAFLKEPSSPATQPFEQPAKVALEELDARIGRLSIQVTPASVPDLVVDLDGVRVPSGELAAGRPTNPGSHTITASGRAHRPTKSTVTLRDGETLTVAITLQPEEGGETSVSGSVTPAPAPPAPPDRTLPLVMMGTGLSVFVTGLSVGLMAMAEAGEAPTSDGPEARVARSKALIGDIVGGTGIAMIGVGVILLLTTGGSSKPAPAEPKAEVSVTPWAEGSAAGVRVRF